MSTAISTRDYLNTTLSTADRAADLLLRMTIEEKVAQMGLVA